jgi:Fe-S cluster assembly protein SufD
MNVETISNIADKKIQLIDSGLKSFRESHLETFKKKGFAETVLDSYKFTNLESFFANLNYEPKASDKDLNGFKSLIPTITFVDGEFGESEKLPAGITVKKLRDNFSLIKDLFKDANALSSLHHSLFCEGLLIEVAKNVETSSIRILNLITKSSITAPTHLIVANPFSKVTVLEETRAFDVSHALVNETYIVAHPGSHVEHIQIEHESSQGINHGSVFADVEKDATVKSFIFHATGKLNRTNLTLNLNAPGANGESYSLFLTHGTEHSDINTVINHHAPDTTSAQIAKGILDGDSKGIFTGLIHIFPKAQRVASSQLNKNLLLSKKAQVHSQPQLEIFADDVKCSHGSTTGQLSPDEVFYFQARGIPADKARTILAHGFGLEIVQKIENKKAREHISNMIMHNLETKFELGGLK